MTFFYMSRSRSFLFFLNIGLIPYSSHDPEIRPLNPDYLCLQKILQLISEVATKPAKQRSRVASAKVKPPRKFMTESEKKDRISNRRKNSLKKNQCSIDMMRVQIPGCNNVPDRVSHTQRLSKIPETQNPDTF